MNTVDQVLLRLADPAARDGLLTADGLLQLAAVCYAFDPATVTGPTTAAYDRVDLAVPLTAEATATARLMQAGDPLPWDVTATFGTGREPVPGADAVVVARLAVRAAPAGGIIEQVATDLPDLDAAFAAALAGLPPNATADQVRAALRTAAGQALAADALTANELDTVLAGVLGDAGADPRRLGRAGGRDTVGVRLTMSAPPPPADATPLVLPVVVAVLVADATASPRDLLRASATARRAALPYPPPDPPRDAPPRRAERCVCWLLPAAAFDDDGWPGGTGGNAAARRAARLAAARAWLADAGIAVVTT